jgi:hypothetical protein
LEIQMQSSRLNVQRSMFNVSVFMRLAPRHF